MPPTRAATAQLTGAVHASDTRPAASCAPILFDTWPTTGAGTIVRSSLLLSQGSWLARGRARRLAVLLRFEVGAPPPRAQATTGLQSHTSQGREHKLLKFWPHAQGLTRWMRSIGISPIIPRRDGATLRLTRGCHGRDGMQQRERERERERKETCESWAWVE